MNLAEPPEDYIQAKYIDNNGEYFIEKKTNFWTLDDIQNDIYNIFTINTNCISIVLMEYTIYLENRKIKSVYYETNYKNNTSIDFLLPDIQKKVLKAVL